MHFLGKKSLSLRESDTGGAEISWWSIANQLVWIGQKIVRGEGPVPHCLPGMPSSRGPGPVQILIQEQITDLDLKVKHLKKSSPPDAAKRRSSGLELSL